LLQTKVPVITVSNEPANGEEIKPADDKENEHDPVTLPPEGRTRLAAHDADTPDIGEIARLTGPDRPERLVKVTVPVADDPALNVTDCAVML